MFRRFAIAVLLLSTSCAPSDTAEEAERAAPADGPPRVAFETNKGRIVVELDPEKAPETVANFLRHVRSGFYNGIIFHRVEAGFVAQAGAVTADRRRRTSSVMGVVNEADNGLKNLEGTLAMARTGDPHSATSEFFFNLKDNEGLDYREPTLTGWGYAVFGRIVEGLAVMHAIGSTPTAPSGRYPNMPVETVLIERVHVVDSAND